MSPLRRQLELNGVWKFCPDIVSEGELFGFHTTEWDDRPWLEAAVPCALESAYPGLEGKQMRVWFRRAFVVPPDWAGLRLTLRFEGVNEHARVWLNGAFLGASDDPFLPFEFEFSPSDSADGRQVLAVEVNNEARPDDVPGEHTGWRRHAGILRDVRVTATDFLRVTELRVEADPETGGVRVKAGVSNGRNKAALAHAEAEITGPGGALALRLPLGELGLEPGANATLQAAGIVGSCRPWSPANPALYRVRVLVRDQGEIVDSDERAFGFRRLAAAPDGLRLNGEPIFLTGFNRHEDSPRTAMAEDRPLTRRDLEQIKEAGANFVRLCHYPHAPAELDLCDSLGLVALAEIPLFFWNNAESGRQNQEARTKRAASQLERMIARDAHHASVLFWSVSNETYDPLPEVAESNRQLIRLARSLDSTRLAVHVSNHWRTYPAFEEDDVICVNAYPGIDMRICGRGPGYDAAKAAAHWRVELGKLHARFPNKPILITEFGGASFKGTSGHLYGEDRHAAIVKSEFEAFDAPYVCGAAIWCWADHDWPPGRFFGGVPVSPYGVLTRDRRPKAAFHAARRMFRKRQGLPDLPEPVAGAAETETDFR